MPRRRLNAFLTVRAATLISFLGGSIEVIAGFAIIMAYFLRPLAKELGGIISFLESLAIIGTVAAYVILFFVIFLAGRLVMYVIRLLITWILIFLSIGILIYYAEVLGTIGSAPVYSALIIFMFLSIIFYATSWGSKTLLKGLEDHKVNLDRIESHLGQLNLSERDSEQLGRLIAGAKKSWSKIARSLAEAMDLPRVFYKSLVISVIFFVVTIVTSQVSGEITMYSYMVGILITLILTMALVLIDTTRIEKMRKELIRSAI